MQRKNTEPQSPIAAGLVCIFVVCFGIFWTIMAASMYWPMAIFGVLFTTIGALNAYNTFKSNIISPSFLVFPSTIYSTW